MGGPADTGRRQALRLGVRLHRAPLRLQIIKAYLEFSLHRQLAGDPGVWFKYEILAAEHMFSLPLKGEGVETVAYMASTLGYTKLMMGHLDLAIDLGKGSLSKRGHAATCDTRHGRERFLLRLTSPEDVGAAAEPQQAIPDPLLAQQMPPPEKQVVRLEALSRTSGRKPRKLSALGFPAPATG